MSHLNLLSNAQKQQIRNAFTMIDGESRDSIITKEDLKNIYSTIGLITPSDTQIDTMFTIDGKPQTQLSFNQFSTVMAKEFNRIPAKSIIYDALRVYSDKENMKTFQDELQIEYQSFKDSCCSAQLGEIGCGDNRLSRSTFDKLTRDFVQTQMDGRQIFLASKWIDSYLD